MPPKKRAVALPDDLVESLRDSLVFERRLSAPALVVQDPAHLARLDRSAWSPSSMDSFGACPARWAFDRFMPQPTDPFDPRCQGTAAHLVFELLFDLPPGQRTKDAAVSILESVHLTHPDRVVFPASTTDLFRWRAEVVARVLPLWRAEDPSLVRVIEQEAPLEGALVGGVPFRGFADRVDHIGPEHDLGVAVRDYKAGKPKTAADRKKYGDAHGHQLRLYALAWESLRGVRPREVSIIYTSNGTTYAADLSASLLTSTRDMFVSTWSAMKESASTGRYPAKPSGLCGYCPMATVCPASSRQVPRIPEGYYGGVVGIRTVDHVLPAPGRATPAPPPSSVAKSDTPMEGPEMTSQPASQYPMGFSTYAYEETVPDGRLNSNSHAARTVFGLTEWAVDLLVEGNVAITGTTVTAMTHTLAGIALACTENLSGRRCWQDGLTSRCIGAMHTAVATYPAPFGGDTAMWSAWVANVTKRTMSIATLATNLWAHGPQVGYEALVGLPLPVAKAG